MNELDYIQEHLDEIQRDIDLAEKAFIEAKEYKAKFIKSLEDREDVIPSYFNLHLEKN